MRDKCIETVTTLREEVVHLLLSDPNAQWRLPDHVGVATSVDEMMIGGVYLNLYVKQPGWELRNPRYLCALFCLQGCGDVNDVVVLWFHGLSYHNSNHSLRRRVGSLYRCIVVDIPWCLLLTFCFVAGQKLYCKEDPRCIHRKKKGYFSGQLYSNNFIKKNVVEHILGATLIQTKFFKQHQITENS